MGAAGGCLSVRGGGGNVQRGGGVVGSGADGGEFKFGAIPTQHQKEEQEQTAKVVSAPSSAHLSSLPAPPP